MYTHWQASWRSGLGLGVAAIAAMLLLSGQFAAETVLQRTLLILAVIGGGALYTLAVVVSFRLGLRYSNRPRVGLNVVILVPVLYLAALSAIAFVRVKTHAQPVEIVTARDALIHNVFIPSFLYFLTFVVLPAGIAYATARLVGGGLVTPNTSFERTRDS